ncbi:MAG: spore coat protein CotS [Hungatella sp.]|nr:spore coat protein CotS [Hungatella sp.]
MNERYMEALGQYDLTVDSVRKGRSGWICETSQGTMLLQEYRGTMKRLEFETQVLGQVRESGLLQVDDYIKTSQGELISLSEDGTRHTLKHWYTGRECNIRDYREARQIIGKIAILHQILKEIPAREEWSLGSIMVETARQVMERHNQELKRARNFMKNKRRKTDFERCALSNFSVFFQQAQEAACGMAQLEQQSAMVPCLCHGDLDQHHVLIPGGMARAQDLASSAADVKSGIEETGVAVIEYHKMHMGDQMTDLYHFVRKIMEKHEWDQNLGLELLTAYDRVNPLSDRDRESLYYLFLYPEKYWKQINFYMNANKAWIPARNLEKLKSLEGQVQQRNRFLAIIK